MNLVDRDLCIHDIVIHERSDRVIIGRYIDPDDIVGSHNELKDIVKKYEIKLRSSK